jgi:hypothetical protein
LEEQSAVNSISTHTFICRDWFISFGSTVLLATTGFNDIEPETWADPIVGFPPCEIASILQDFGSAFLYFVPSLFLDMAQDSDAGLPRKPQSTPIGPNTGTNQAIKSAATRRPELRTRRFLRIIDVATAARARWRKGSNCAASEIQDGLD